MGQEWDGRPQWQREGRTGPNGPRYASAADRNRARAGKQEKIGKPGLIAKLFGKGKSK